MKKSAITTIGLVFTALFLLLSTAAFTQWSNIWKGAPEGTNIWKGGTPGMENDWYCPKNWSKYKVPDAFSDVIIPDVSSTTLSMPVIKDGRAEAHSLFIYPAASLTVAEPAQLVVYQPESAYFRDYIHANGQLFFINEDYAKGAQATTAIVKQ